MMVERHYDEEALIAILHSGEEDPHLKACTTCSDTLESYRTITGTLREEEVWNVRDPHEAGAARGAAALRAFVASKEKEDVQARELVDELLTSPRQWWTATVINDERYQNAGVARRLIEVSEAKIDTMPSEAVEIAATAIAVTDIIDGGESVLQLRGAAYRQYGYALFYVGEFARALDAVERGQVILERCAVSEYALARLDIVRSFIYAEQQKHDEALAVARRAGRVFQTFGDVQRFVSAQMSEAYLLGHVSNVRGALSIFQDLQQRFWSEIDPFTRALLVANIGGCQSRLRQPADALQSLQIAAELYDELGNKSEAARVRYNVGSLLAEQGRHSDAKKRLREVQADFARLGMVHAGAVAGLDLAEIALLENDYKEVEHLCRAAMQQFETAGVTYSTEALTALTFLREAAEQRRATQEIVWHVKTYIRRLPDEPALLFAPAPLPPT
ncbi:MAG TPA: tetratricopeptide repeat protein [Thermoanaerobaculia bacterium]